MTSCCEIGAIIRARWPGPPIPIRPCGRVVVVDVWKTTPFVALLILAALQMLPGDLFEAARVDGVCRFAPSSGSRCR